ncbi:30S ribosomal protein S19e [Candidatus Aciduliprofundum boonei]|uniref:Small ribosomal subunit protein eS19 n=1 Tax=Aciduliprofundum boonei (strain DSM 19572 / T469) TaxID=439481 RepID=B5IFD7_ACIB4|nr:30S ribosomal protein S19e [Candidatus Aciduliprofundum boonei]ADD07836.1 Ribosomal protein S19e [Aciduliprofundum boonei T469]EDY34506.1 ribosomal protein S19e [Aciduliprofundum boonei T469]EDY34975.1 ribosomal protein S19e [Aciduliprofundum boonei T469]HII54940.1 30S ribosomal protein S19e [Candidatus Aciduliprofundum boonei]
MVTVYDVPPEKLIASVAEKLKEEKIEPPEWSRWVTTGVHKEKGPEQEDWWYIRLASVLRKIYIMGPIGTSRLAAEYGGKEDRGSKRYKARKGSRAIVRKALQQLESLGYVKKDKKGRVITPKGRSFMDNVAHEIMKELVKESPELEKYTK